MGIFFVKGDLCFGENIMFGSNNLKVVDNKAIGNNDEARIVAIIAGGGDLPTKIIQKLESLGRTYVVASINGHGPSEYESFEIGAVGALLDFVKKSGAKEVLFCGSVKRPSFMSLKLDQIGKKWLTKLGVRAFLGDDALLKGVRKLLEKEGLLIISPQSILSTLLTPGGILTKMRPTDIDLQDIARGLFVLNTLSKTDIGQAAIIQEGVVLGVEAAEGTDNLIRRCLGLKVSEHGGVLVKTAKLNQDKSMDLPTIGKATILEAHSSKLSGIAIGQGQSQILDYEDTIKMADELGIFVIGV